PLKAAIIKKNEGNTNEAYWLALIATHFGKSAVSGWRLARDIYGGIYSKNIWTWNKVSEDPGAFKDWYNEVYETLISDGIVRRFGNHRKYETLLPDTYRSLPNVFDSYVTWIGPDHDHETIFRSALKDAEGDKRAAFDILYKSMGQVVSFGRTAKFDYLTMVAKLSLSDIEPGKAYIVGSTGPRLGAKLLFYGNSKANIRSSVLETKLIDLDKSLSLGALGLQVLEDALCNWQKNPRRHVFFRG
ncbi:MAG: hypothetical protein JAZ17_15190, partial [Candidatus Thiodiazotropha endolucinida]|nr:hypothetical protein [Candidatus Thiodiazotropha endolucinida]